ncbi:uncharacterized protein CMU_011320 [Cryptosporidium muris RN66]|uniref:Uncharacterized protein n=1 Tax=Cryptosporidium muris (strain RN66) TaxID=441375 RepID=B6AIZ2_CRYMR|nr:uncharacterized protein CMU_011320 [Cryptosporidium muris RN66]EEA08183.1 hypothetical protein, conserved [Cryptosporidium muris RN66]|eukprot:XP_002142532.1 hypothetical protein [Cryptosporidium muris RN66]
MYNFLNLATQLSFQYWILYTTTTQGSVVPENHSKALAETLALYGSTKIPNSLEFSSNGQNTDQMLISEGMGKRIVGIGESRGDIVGTFAISEYMNTDIYGNISKNTKIPFIVNKPPIVISRKQIVDEYCPNKTKDIQFSPYSSVYYLSTAPPPNPQHTVWQWEHINKPILRNSLASKTYNESKRKIPSVNEVWWNPPVLKTPNYYRSNVRRENSSNKQSLNKTNEDFDSNNKLYHEVDDNIEYNALKNKLDQLSTSTKLKSENIITRNEKKSDLLNIGIFNSTENSRLDVLNRKITNFTEVSKNITEKKENSVENREIYNRLNDTNKNSIYKDKDIAENKQNNITQLGNYKISQNNNIKTKDTNLTKSQVNLNTKPTASNKTIHDNLIGMDNKNYEYNYTLAQDTKLSRNLDIYKSIGNVTKYIDFYLIDDNNNLSNYNYSSVHNNLENIEFNQNPNYTRNYTKNKIVLSESTDSIYNGIENFNESTKFNGYNIQYYKNNPDQIKNFIHDLKSNITQDNKTNHRDIIKGDIKDIGILLFEENNLLNNSISFNNNEIINPEEDQKTHATIGTAIDLKKTEIPNIYNQTSARDQLITNALNNLKSENWSLPMEYLINTTFIQSDTPQPELVPNQLGPKLMYQDFYCNPQIHKCTDLATLGKAIGVPLWNIYNMSTIGKIQRRFSELADDVERTATMGLTPTFIDYIEQEPIIETLESIGKGPTQMFLLEEGGNITNFIDNSSTLALFQNNEFLEPKYFNKTQQKFATQVLKAARACAESGFTLPNCNVTKQEGVKLSSSQIANFEKLGILNEDGTLKIRGS